MGETPTLATAPTGADAGAGAEYTPNITDVRALSPLASSSLRSQIIAGLSRPPHARTLPTVILYGGSGLRIYDNLTAESTAYYPFAEEEGILKTKSDEIVRLMGLESQAGVMVELGAGALRKTSLLLRAMAKLAPSPPHTTTNLNAEDAQQPPFTYYALDLEQEELARSLRLLMSTYGPELSGKVHAHGLWGTYEGGIEFVRSGGIAASACASASALAGGGTPAEAQVAQDDDLQSTPVLTKDGMEQFGEAVERGRKTQRNLEVPTGLQTTDSSVARSSTPPLSMSSCSASESSPSTPPLATPAPTQRPLASDSEGDHPPLHLLFLGSSLGNLTRQAAAPFLASLPLRPGSKDTLLLGLDGRNEKWLVEAAYSPQDHWTNEFIMNGLTNAARELGEPKLERERWEYVERYDADEGRHEAYYRAKEAMRIVVPPLTAGEEELSADIAKGEDINIEYSYKYSREDAATLFSAANLRVIEAFHSPNLNTETGEPLYTLYLLERPAFHFPLLPSLERVSNAHVFHPTLHQNSTRSSSSPNAHESSEGELSVSRRVPTGGVPTLEEWNELWKAWDCVTVGMIPEHMMHRKPIDLRHKCLFYLGHIPAFLDIHLSRLFQEPHTEPEYFKDIFERGIDPNVDDPTQCHDHSIVPEKDEDWPTLDQILAFRDAVRMRVAQLYEHMETGEKDETRRVGRILSIVFEHEIMHLETLLYMLIQVSGEEQGAQPPPGFATPPFASLAEDWNAFPPTSPAPTFLLEAGSVSIGHDDYEDRDFQRTDPRWKEIHEFGWDNETPRRLVEHGSVRIETVPITNGEYRVWWEQQLGRIMPASWVLVEHEIQVRTLYGPVEFSYARHWPLQASYDDIATFAASKGGRIPTEFELRKFLDQTDAGEQANVGFKNWHPVPPVWDVQKGKGHNGGVWEWTSTVMDQYEGFVPSGVYPGYSNDFNDGTHHVVLGGSYATHPRIAQRRTFRNFWQHNYPFAWIGARVAYDVDMATERAVVSRDQGLWSLMRLIAVWFWLWLSTTLLAWTGRASARRAGKS